MKWIASLALGLCVLLAGCTGQTQVPPPATSQAPRVYTWQSHTLVDTQQCRLALESITRLQNGDLQLTLNCENRTQEQVMLCCQNIMLDGWLIRDFWGEEFPGYAMRTCQVILPAEQIGAADDPQRLDMTVKAFSQADLSQAYLCNQSITLYAKEVNPGRFQSPQSPLTAHCRVLADNSGCSFSMAYTGTDGAGQHFACILENKTRQELAFRIHSIDAQGWELEQVWTVQLPAGARCSRELLIPTKAARGELSVHIQKQDKWFSDVLVNERFIWEAAQ